MEHLEGETLAQRLTRTQHDAMAAFEARRSDLQKIATDAGTGGKDGFSRPRGRPESPTRTGSAVVRPSCKQALGAGCRRFKPSRPDHSSHFSRCSRLLRRVMDHRSSRFVLAVADPGQPGQAETRRIDPSKRSDYFRIGESVAVAVFRIATESAGKRGRRRAKTPKGSPAT